MKIHGIVVTRNDWGVLALSITNVLINHADVVHVLNHGSNDQTAEGLRILKEIWGERLKVYSASPDIPFHQSLLTNMIVSLAEEDGADWIYVFDSDEFLLKKRDFSLKEELSKLDSSTVGLRYILSNYISTYNFNEKNIDCYKHLIYKSVPNTKYDELRAIELISTGHLTFFDLPFPSKIIFRANKNLLIDKGSHKLKYFFKNQMIETSTLLNCAHLSLISKSTLISKSKQGKSLIDLGLSPKVGWQNQLVYQLDLAGKLDWFWEKHSIKKEKNDTSNPVYVIDHSLVECLNSSINLLKEKFFDSSLTRFSGVSLRTGYEKSTDLNFLNTFQMCLFFDKKIDLFIRANNKK
jgi:hypothetical protein